MRQITRLARPFPQRFIKRAPQGKYGDYVSHDVVWQKLILELGAPPHFEVKQVIRDADSNQIVGVVGRMSTVVDGEHVVVEEAGDCENPGNWKNDGARLKDAVSDAAKRCAMRLGCGLHLWSQDSFILYDQLARQDSEAEQDAAATEADPAASKDSEGAGPSENGDSQSSPAAPSEATQQAVW